MSANMEREERHSGEIGSSTGLRRRAILKGLAAFGVGTEAFRRALTAQAVQAGKVTPEMIRQAEWIAGLELTDKEREGAARRVTESLESFHALRKTPCAYDVPPAVAFNPAPGLLPGRDVRRNQAKLDASLVSTRPGSDEELAFLPVARLAGLLRSGQVKS